jgi:hypothetical protein
MLVDPARSVSRWLVMLGMLMPAVLKADPLSGWPTDPTVNLALSDTASTQTHPFMVTDGQGMMFGMWWDGLARVQCVDSSGSITTGWPTAGLRIHPRSNFDYNRLLSSGVGQAIACVYNADINRIVVHKFDRNASRLWGVEGSRFQVSHGGLSYCPVSLPDGGLIVAWVQEHDPEMLWDNLYAMRIDSLGNRVWTEDFPLCDAPGPQKSLRGTLSSDTTVIFTWLDARADSMPPFSIWELYAQELSVSKREAWGHNGRLIRLDRSSDPITSNANLGDGIASDRRGGAYVVLRDVGVHPSGDVIAVRIDSTGSMAAGWPAVGLELDTATASIATGPFYSPSVDVDGSLIVLWSRTDVINDQIIAQKVRADGVPLWGVGGLALNAWEQHASRGTGADGRGGVFFVDGPGIGAEVRDAYVQHLLPDGALQWPGRGVLFTRGHPGSYVVVKPDSSGGVFLCWPDGRTPQGTIYAQHVNADGTLGGDVVDALLSLASADATSDRVSLRWYTTDRAIAGADVERSDGDGEWRVLVRIEPDGSGMLSYEDTDVVPGHRYGYRLNVTLGGNVSAMGEAWVSVPAGAEFALRNVQPNPSDGELSVSFALPGDAPARLEVLDLAGRRVASREVGTLGEGTHVVRFTREASALRPGVYAIRLTSGGRSVTTRAVVVR